MSQTKELTNALLKEKMTDALVLRSGKDFDTCLTPGHYAVNAESWINHPKGSYRYGTMVVSGDVNSFITQEYITHNTLNRYWRIYYKPHNQSTGPGADTHLRAHETS